MIRASCIANGAALMAVVLAWRVMDGSAFDLVQGWYRPVLLLTIAVLAALAAWAFVPLMRSQGRAVLRPDARGLLGGAVVALPIVLMVVFRPAPLGSASLARMSSDDALLAGLAISARDPAERNLFQWASAFVTETPATLAGQPISVVAFVHHPDDAAPGRFMAARFVVACCVADARGIALPVEWPEAGALASDAWVEIEGEVALSAAGEPFIRAHRVTVTDAPANPYLYP